MSAQPTTHTVDRRQEKVSAFDRLFSYDVIDRNDRHVGNIVCLWTDEEGIPQFIGLQTWWLTGRTHAVPAHGITVNHADMQVKVSYDENTVRNSPTHDPEAQLGEEEFRELCAYYGFERRETEAPHSAGTDQPPTPRSGAPRSTVGEREPLIPGTRPGDAGAFHLRKVVPQRARDAELSSAGREEQIETLRGAAPRSEAGPEPREPGERGAQ